MNFNLDNLKYDFHIVGISESWLQETNKDCYDLENYRAEHNCRPNRTGGGVSLYIKQKIDYELRNDLSYQNRTIESLFIEIDKNQLKNKQNVVVGVIYRPPNTDIHEFNEFLEDCLDKIKAEKKKAYLLGDFNINLLNSDQHIPSKEFIDTLFSHSFMPFITKPTRVTQKSATLIDNIFL